MSITAVQEVQGLYGPFTVSERVIQKIWLQGDFHQQDLKTSSGKSLKILDPGSWNMNEGPDFKEARLLIDGRDLLGDVEIHFYPNDWFSHGHDQNPNFRKVLLHVLLYPGTGGNWAAEFPMESLVLLPLLERDLEEYVMEAALLDLEQVNELEWFERFMAKPLAERRSLLEDLATERWEQKAAYAARRLERAGWSRCCHESTLEVLGFARNRSTMHKIAAHYAIDDFSRGLDTGQIFEDFRAEWKLSGCRPANHPKLRLQQYARICQAHPDWPEQLRSYLKRAKMAALNETTQFRKGTEAKEWQALLGDELFRGMIGSKRLNSLLCDAIFPLAQGELDGSWQAYWRHWYPGDYPDAFARFFRQSGLAHARLPMSNGLMQGILALFASHGRALDAPKPGSI